AERLVVVGISHHVRHMYHRALKDRPRRHGPPAWAHRKHPLNELHTLSRDMGVRRQMYQLTIVPADHAEGTFAQAHRASSDGIEYWLYVGRRAADDAKDLARGSLLIERLGHLRMRLRQRLVLLLELLEQPHVLDGNHSLGGEDLQKLDLSLGKASGLGARDGDRPDGDALTQHRDRHDASIRLDPRLLAKPVVRIGVDV